MSDIYVYFLLDLKTNMVRIGNADKVGIPKGNLLGLVPNGSLTAIYATFAAHRAGRDVFNYVDDIQKYIDTNAVTSNRANLVIKVVGAESEYQAALEVLTTSINFFKRRLGTRRFIFRLVAKESVRAALANAINNKLYVSWSRNAWVYQHDQLHLFKLDGKWSQQYGNTVPAARRWDRLVLAIGDDVEVIIEEQGRHD